MYLRHTTVTKNGKSNTYWRLVRSIRTGNRVRQQTVAQLGELDAAGRVRARALAEAIVGVERQPGLFDAPGPSESVTVELRRFRLERGRRFGDVWLGLRLWQALGLDALLESLLPPGREEVPWAKMAAVLVLARFCEPSSELHIAVAVALQRTMLRKVHRPSCYHRSRPCVMSPTIHCLRLKVTQDYPSSMFVATVFSSVTT